MDSLHRAGRHIAMTGDSVKTCLALEKADVGIRGPMGLRRHAQLGGIVLSATSSPRSRRAFEGRP